MRDTIPGLLCQNLEHVTLLVIGAYNIVGEGNRALATKGDFSERKGYSSDRDKPPAVAIDPE